MYQPQSSLSLTITPLILSSCLKLTTVLAGSKNPALSPSTLAIEIRECTCPRDSSYDQMKMVYEMHCKGFTNFRYHIYYLLCIICIIYYYYLLCLPYTNVLVVKGWFRVADPIQSQHDACCSLSDIFFIPIGLHRHGGWSCFMVKSAVSKHTSACLIYQRWRARTDRHLLFIKESKTCKTRQVADRWYAYKTLYNKSREM